MYKDPSGITPIPPQKPLVKRSRRHFCWKSPMNWQALNNFTADGTTGWKTKTKPSGTRQINYIWLSYYMGNGIYVKTRAPLKRRRGTTQKKWIFCIEVAFTQGVCLAGQTCAGARGTATSRGHRFPHPFARSEGNQCDYCITLWQPCLNFQSAFNRLARFKPKTRRKREGQRNVLNRRSASVHVWWGQREWRENNPQFVVSHDAPQFFWKGWQKNEGGQQKMKEIN